MHLSVPSSCRVGPDVSHRCLQRMQSPTGGTLTKGYTGYHVTGQHSRADLKHAFLHLQNHYTDTARGMATEMLKFLTQKLKSQSLNEVQPHQLDNVDDDEKDSGTESDENLDDEYPYGSKSSLHDDSVLNNNELETSTDLGGPKQSVASSGAKTHEISEHNFDTVSCTSDYERHSLDFDRHSSEDELVTINKENVAEKRKWSQVTHRSGYCDSAGSSDDEVKDFLFNPQPVLLSASPPKGVQKVYTHLASPRQVLARMAPLSVSSVSPRKRHRHNATSDNICDTDSGSLTRRPCLDFEKMQQVQAFV